MNMIKSFKNKKHKINSSKMFNSHFQIMRNQFNADLNHYSAIRNQIKITDINKLK